MAWKLLPHGRNVYYTSFSHCATSPCIVEFLFFVVFQFRVPWDAATEKSVQNLVNLHLFPLGGHKVSLGRWMGMYWERVIMWDLKLVLSGGNFLGSYFAASDPVYEGQLLISEDNIPHIELISDGPPPIFVLRFLDELFQLIGLLFLLNRVELVIVPEVLELIIPSIGDFANFDSGELVLLVIGVLFLFEDLRGQECLSLGGHGGGQMVLLQHQSTMDCLTKHNNKSLQIAQIHPFFTKIACLLGYGQMIIIIIRCRGNRYIMTQSVLGFDCQTIKYLDCRNWFDVASQILIIFPCLYIFYFILTHYLNLSGEEEPDSYSEYQKSIRRKKWINFILILYLVFFVGSVLLSIGFFIPYLMGNLTWIFDHKIDRIYKIFEILFISWLNALNITVGFLYWKAMRGYYVLAGMNIPFLTRRGFKFVFQILYSLCVSSIVVAIVWAFTPYLTEHEIAYVTLFNTVFSILICIGCRFTYRKIILTKLQLSERAIRKQKICSCLILLSSMLRIFIYALEIGAGDTWFTFTRDYDPSNCIDRKPYSAIIIFFINALINVMPVFVYAHLFMSELKRRKVRLLEGESSSEN